MRLRRIRFKDGRAPIEVLHTKTDIVCNGEAENLRGALLRTARKIAGYCSDESPLDGFIILGLFANGERSLAFRVPKRLPRELLPAYVAETLRTDAITDQEAADVFDKRFEWVE